MTAVGHGVAASSATVVLRRYWCRRLDPCDHGHRGGQKAQPPDAGTRLTLVVVAAVSVRTRPAVDGAQAKTAVKQSVAALSATAGRRGFGCCRHKPCGLSRRGAPRPRRSWRSLRDPCGHGNRERQKARPAEAGTAGGENKAHPRRRRLLRNGSPPLFMVPPARPWWSRPPWSMRTRPKVAGAQAEASVKRRVAALSATAVCRGSGCRRHNSCGLGRRGAPRPRRSWPSLRGQHSYGKALSLQRDRGPPPRFFRERRQR